MKPPPFRYHDPKTVSEAVGLLAQLENAKLLAGGQSLMPMLNIRFVQPDHIIDLNLVEGLSYIREVDGALEIGAMTRQRDLEFSDLVRARWPIMHEALLQVGHRQTRNRGTIGGSLCHLDPAAELVSVGDRATTRRVTVAGPNGPREIAVRGVSGRLYDAGDRAERNCDRRALPAVGRAITAMPLSSSRAGTAISPSCRPPSCSKMTPPARSPAPRSRIGGMGTAPVRAREVEQALIGQAPTGELFRAACESCRKIEAIDDVHAPASYRQHLLRAACCRARALDPSGRPHGALMTVQYRGPRRRCKLRATAGHRSCKRPRQEPPWARREKSR